MECLEVPTTPTSLEDLHPDRNLGLSQIETAYRIKVSPIAPINVSRGTNEIEDTTLGQ